MWKILVTATNYSKYCEAGKSILEKAGCRIIENPYGRPFTFEELIEVSGEIDGVVFGVDTWDEAVFALAPKLKVMARFGVGVDNVDLSAAKRRGIVVCNCPGINSSAVAEHAAALMFSLLRQIPRMDMAVRKGQWPRPMFHELRGRTVGFVGFGAIARSLAERLRGFHPHLIAYDKFPDEEGAGGLGVKMVSKEELFRDSDILSIHLPVMEETRHFICRETIERMKPGVLIVNTARGSIVKETDMAEALKSGRVGGLGTDVFEKEPIDLNSPLFGFDNYIATPHIAAETYENCETTSIVSAHAVLDVLEGREPDNRLV